MTCKKLKLISAVALLPIFLFAVGSAEGIIIDRIVAKVNDEIVTLSEVQEKGYPTLSKVRKISPGDSEEVKTAEKQILERIINLKLQLQDAKELGMTVSEAEIEKTISNIQESNNITFEALERMLKESGSDLENYRKEITDQILIQKIYYFRVIASAKVNPKEIRSYYRKHTDEYTGQEKVKVSQIFFGVDPDNPAKREDIVRARALEVWGQIKAGNDFAQLAKAYSEGGNASRGGLLGFFERGETLPILEKAMFNLESGEVSDLIRTKAGLHLLKVDEHIYPKPKPLEEVEPEITKILKEEKAEQNYQAWLDRLREKAFVEVVYDLEQ